MACDATAAGVGTVGPAGAAEFVGGGGLRVDHFGRSCGSLHLQLYPDRNQARGASNAW